MSTLLVEQNPLLDKRVNQNPHQVGIVALNNLSEVAEPFSVNNETEYQIDYLSFNDLEKSYIEHRNLDAERKKCGILKFIKDGQEITDLTAYNAAPPIREIGMVSNTEKPYFILSVRTERREDEKESETILFRAESAFATEWEQINDESIKSIKGQDPKTSKIGENLFVSVVEVEEVLNSDEKTTHLKWWQKFYKGPNIRNLELIGRGPDGMKNITPVEMTNGEIIVFTRPQNPDDEKMGGLGQIGTVTIKSIDEIKNQELLQVDNAPLINTRFVSGEEWGGVGQATALKYGLIGIIGHIAKLPKNYCTISGIYDPKSRKLINIKVESMADEFSGVISKTPEHLNISYGTGITEPDNNGNVMLFQGVGDVATGYKIIKDPFVGLRLLE